MINESKKEYYCNFCNYNTINISDWIKHNNTKKHQRNGLPIIHNCSICEYKSRTLFNYKLHMLSQHSTKEERMKQKYYCHICDIVLFCNTYMLKHLNGKFHKNKEMAQKYQLEIINNFNLLNNVIS